MASASAAVACAWSLASPSLSQGRLGSGRRRPLSSSSCQLASSSVCLRPCQGAEVAVSSSAGVSARVWGRRQAIRCCLDAVSSQQYEASSRTDTAAAAAGQRRRRIVLTPVEATPETFAPFGQVIGPTDDGAEFGDDDAQLQLDRGTPRFYIMRLPRRGRVLDRITHHAKVTQCLGSLGDQSWYMAVCPPGTRPSEDNIVAFRVPPRRFIRMHATTWHAGPYFEDEEMMDFYNLELSDTNVVDHNNHYFGKEGLEFEIAMRPVG
eukprot:jgi/Chlat1/2613/Chrsp178S02461